MSEQAGMAKRPAGLIDRIVLQRLKEATMATLPADEDYAKAILTIFRARDVRPGQSLRASQVNVEFLAKNMGRAADYEAALQYSAEQGWLTIEFERIRLTKAGFAEM